MIMRNLNSSLLRIEIHLIIMTSNASIVNFRLQKYLIIVSIDLEIMCLIQDALTLTTLIQDAVAKGVVIGATATTAVACVNTTTTSLLILLITSPHVGFLVINLSNVINNLNYIKI